MTVDLTATSATHAKLPSHPVKSPTKRRVVIRLWRPASPFPRVQREPWVTQTFFPYTGQREDWLNRVLEAARLASRAWRYAMRSGLWGNVDGDCLMLAVFDKVFEMNLRQRPGVHPSLVKRLRKGKAETRRHRSVAEWRVETSHWTEDVYHQALGTIPSTRSLVLPTMHDVLDIVRTLLDLGFRPGIDAQVQWSASRCYEMMGGFSPSMLGKWDPHLPVRAPGPSAYVGPEPDLIVYN